MAEMKSTRPSELNTSDLRAAGQHGYAKIVSGSQPNAKPFNHFLIARALLDLRLEIIAFHAFEAKEHVIHRTIEMIFPDIARHESAAFVDRASKNRVATDPNAWTARRFPR